MTLLDILILIGKTTFCYFFVFIVLKIMGKREVGEISTFDIVVFMVISELFSISINEIDTSLLHSVVPIIVIVVLQLVTALLSLNFKKIRKVMEGKPTYLIIDGKINQEELKRNRYNIDNLLMQLRQNEIESPSFCAFALLEGNGTLTIVKKDEKKMLYPEPLIVEGEINEIALKRTNISKQKLMLEMSKSGFKDIKEIFLCEVFVDGQFVFVRKE